VIEKPSQFNGTILQPETIDHHQDDIYIVWSWLGGDVTPEDDEPLNPLSPPR